MADEATGQGAAAAPAATPAATPSPAAGGGASTQVDPAAQQQITQQFGDDQQQQLDPNAAAATDDQQLDQFGDIFDQNEEVPPGAVASAEIQELLGINPNVNTPELLQGAVADAGLMWDVIKGSQPASALFETLRVNNPQAWQAVMQGTAEYIEKLTGMKLMDPAAPGADGKPAAQLTPDQQRIQQLEQQQNADRQNREQQAQTQRVNAAQKQTITHITNALKGSFMEGQEIWALSQVGMKLMGREMEVIDALQRGDTTLLDRTLKQVRHEERIRFNAYGKKLVAGRKGLANGLPKADGAGARPDARPATGDYDLKTAEGRMKYSEAVLKGEAAV